jgi:hypothetical protein
MAAAPTRATAAPSGASSAAYVHLPVGSTGSSLRRLSCSASLLPSKQVISTSDATYLENFDSEINHREDQATGAPVRDSTRDDRPIDRLRTSPGGPDGGGALGDPTRLRAVRASGPTNEAILPQLAPTHATHVADG